MTYHSTERRHVRTIDALAGRDTGGTTGFFRALSEADDFCNAREERDELRTRVDELEAEQIDLRQNMAAAIESYKQGRWHDLVGDIDSSELALHIVSEALSGAT